MKKILWMSLILYFSMLLIPFSTLGKGTGNVIETITSVPIINEESEKVENTEEISDYFRVYNHETKKVVK